MKRLPLAIMILVIGFQLSAEKPDSRANLANFYALSRNDFAIDAKSNAEDEKKAYASSRKADIDGGKADGKITYREYLNSLNATRPDSVGPFDFALSELLPSLNDFRFIDNGDLFATGTLAKAVTIGTDCALSEGTTVSFFAWGGLRANLPRDSALRGLPVRGGKDTPVDCVLGEGDFYPASFQLATDAVIGGVPCKAAPVASWDITTELQGNGAVRRAILSQEYLANGIVFRPNERIQLRFGDNQLEAAVILEDKAIQGKSAIALTFQPRADAAQQGLWGGQNPNVFFENGSLKMCYERDKTVGNASIPGVNAYFYDATGSVTGMTPRNAYFLGYPAALDIPKQSWEWGVPQPTVTIIGGQATFTTDASVQLEGGSKKLSLPEGSKVTIDLATGRCLAATMPTGATIAYAAQDGMKPAQVPADRQNSQTLRWVEQWLSSHPETKDGGNADIRQAHIQLRDRLVALEKKATLDALYLKCVNVALLYAEKVKGLVPGNVAFDLNGDKTIQPDELIPSASLVGDDNELSLERLAAHLVTITARLPRENQVTLGKILGTLPITSASESLGVFDSLGSALSKAGIHPFASRKIYYFPNGSGDKALCRNIEFFPSGMPRLIKLEVQKKDTPPFKLSIPSQSEKIELWLYNDERLEKENPGNRQTNGFWHDANEVEFWESGSLRHIGNFAFTQILLPPEYGSALNPAPGHRVLWTPEGRVYQLVQAGNDTPGNSFKLSDAMSIGYFYSITWMNAPECRVEIGLENAIAVDLFFRKGRYTLYKEDPKTKKLIPYEKTFDADTTVKVVGGFWVNAKGDITRYWGEMKK